MKSASSNDDNPKATQSKSSKKSTKSRSKSSKNDTSHSNLAVPNAAVASIASATFNNNSSLIVTTPTTPTSTISNVNNLFDAATVPSGSGNSNATTDANNMSSGSSGSRSHHKNYFGFESRSIKIIWEQHDQSDIELSQEVCTRLAEDASYKMYELVNNIKTYARHSGEMVTYDLVNEVFRDADVPPALGAMDSAWERIDYDGSYFFYSDKILELREEYQREIRIEMPYGADFTRSCIVEDKHLELLRKYIPSLIYVTLHGDNASFESVMQEAAFSSLIGACYRVLLSKIIQILAYKQTDRMSSRCWRLLRACAINPHANEIDCREEYYHLAEILICQLIGPLECIKPHRSTSVTTDETFDTKSENIEVKSEQTLQHEQISVKPETLYAEPQHQQEQQPQQDTTTFVMQESEQIFRLVPDEDGTNDADVDMTGATTSSNAAQQTPHYSPYFASPVDMKHIVELSTTLGHLGAMSGYFQSESLFLITRRLERFFDGRTVRLEREYNYIGRAVRGLVALGEYAFREFIPFIYRFPAEEVPENIWNDFALAAVYLHGPDDIFLYEWLEYVCGGDKLQPFMVYYAEYHEKLLTTRFLQRKQPTFKINPKPGVRRLEWSTLAAAMCHGDDPNKALKPKPSLSEVFPELVQPNLNLNRSGNIRFKFAGCRPVILKSKTKENVATTQKVTQDGRSGNVIGQHDILIAKRKLFKPLSNERRTVHLSNYFYVRI